MPDAWKVAARVLLAGLAAIAAPRTGRATDDTLAPAAQESTTWAWNPSLLLHVVPGEPAYFQPTLAVDHGGLHLEGRYNYEARDTGSAWVG
jgi:hypothetical protein